MTFTAPGRQTRRGSALVGASAAILVWVLAWQFGFVRTAAGQHALNPDWPSRAAPEAAAPLGRPAPVTHPSPSYRFARGPDAAPVTFDPCRTLHYVIRRTNMPPGGELIVAESMRRLSLATGLRLVYDGESDETPSAGRPAVNKALYGDRWAPVLIAWSGPAEYPDLDGDIAGLGGGVGVSAAGSPEVYVSGSLTLDAPQLEDMLALAQGPELVRAVILHELAHVVGLGHVEDPGQLMSPDLSPGVTDYADGDLTGLAALGSGPCIPGI
jgi:hypothetical protein